MLRQCRSIPSENKGMVVDRGKEIRHNGKKLQVTDNRVQAVECEVDVITTAVIKVADIIMATVMTATFKGF